MIGKQIEERRYATLDEKKAALKRSYGICACCGKKLSLKTMTLEHIIPLSRGGTYEPENFVALCYDCNQLKDNLLYMPMGFYSALRNKPVFTVIEQYVENWFKTIKDDFDLTRYPLISPRYYVQIDPVTNNKSTKNQPMIPQLMVEWRIVGTELYEEVEAVTGINIRQIRQYMQNTCIKKPTDTNTSYPIALYNLRKMSSDKLLAVVAVKYEPNELDGLTIFMPWYDMPKAYVPFVLRNFVGLILHTLVNVADKSLTSYTLISNDRLCISDFIDATYMPHFIGTAVRHIEYEEPEYNNKTMHAAQVSRIPQLDLTQIKKQLT